MSTEKPPTNLYTALLAAMKAAGPVIKNAQNPHLKNYYADLSAVLDAIEQPLWDNGLLIVQRFQYDTVGRNGGREAEGTPILITELIHAASGECIASQVPVVSKDPTDPQKMGGAITYYRRYSLLALLGLSPEDDDGHAASQPRPQPAPARNAAPAFAQARAAPAPAPAARQDEAGRARAHALKRFGPVPATLPEVEAPLAQQVRTNDESLSPGEYQRYHDLEAKRKELLAAAPPEPVKLTDEQERVVAQAWEMGEARETYGATAALMRTLKIAATEEQWAEINRHWSAIRRKHYPQTTQAERPAAYAG
jgi:hypothetical protein